jgi:hypothetical protein
MRERQQIATGASRTAAASAGLGLAHHKRGFLIATLAAVLMVFTGAFGTGELPLWMRFAYWVPIMEAGALIGIGASTGVRIWGGLAARPVAEGALVSVLIAAPLTLFVAVMTFGFFGARAVSATMMLTMFAMVLGLTGAITAVNYATGRTVQVEVPVPATVPAAAPPVAAKFRERLPRHLRDAEIHALEAEDHYLRVHTSAGADLILLRLGDAVAELEGLDGARTHRSWWVARDAVRAVRRADGRAELTLPGEVIAPVSRSFVRGLQQAGWFA